MAFPKNFTELIGVRLPIIQAPMAGSSDAELVIAVSESGGLGSLPCAMLNAAKVRSAYRHIRQRTTQPVNLKFFCHRTIGRSRTRAPLAGTFGVVLHRAWH